jgi:hypothetical protein
LKLFHRTNEIVRLTLENRRLEAENAALRERWQGKEGAGEFLDLSESAGKHRRVQPPVIVSPVRPIPILDILRYEPDNHEKLYQMGYEDARAAWVRAGRAVEGQGSAI